MGSRGSGMSNTATQHYYPIPLLHSSTVTLPWEPMHGSALAVLLKRRESPRHYHEMPWALGAK